jgi:hypothetical protein
VDDCGARSGDRRSDYSVAPLGGGNRSFSVGLSSDECINGRHVGFQLLVVPSMSPVDFLPQGDGLAPLDAKQKARPTIGDAPHVSIVFMRP